MNIGFVGPGKVGCSLGAYLKAHGYSVMGYFGGHAGSAKEAASITKSQAYDTVSSLIDDCDIIFFTVPDGKIQDVWKQIQQESIAGKMFCHCSGALSSEIFQGYESVGAFVCSVHPLLAIPNKQSDGLLQSAFFTIEGSKEKLEIIRDMLENCGNQVQEILPEHKMRYHAAAVLASNLAIGLMEEAADVLKQSGFSEKKAKEAFASLAIGNLNNYFRVGAQQALTGPVERNDVETVQKHLQVLDEDTKRIYRDLSKRIVKVAKKKHKESDYRQMKQVLEGEKR